MRAPQLRASGGAARFGRGGLATPVSQGGVSHQSQDEEWYSSYPHGPVMAGCPACVDRSRRTNPNLASPRVARSHDKREKRVLFQSVRFECPRYPGGLLLKIAKRMPPARGEVRMPSVPRGDCFRNLTNECLFHGRKVRGEASPGGLSQKSEVQLGGRTPAPGRDSSRNLTNECPSAKGAVRMPWVLTPGGLLSKFAKRMPRSMQERMFEPRRSHHGSGSALRAANMAWKAGRP
jgi:hypothetical protein